jgi:hypothetical protein
MEALSVVCAKTFGLAIEAIIAARKRVSHAKKFDECITKLQGI